MFCSDFENKKMVFLAIFMAVGPVLDPVVYILSITIAPHIQFFVVERGGSLREIGGGADGTTSSHELEHSDPKN